MVIQEAGLSVKRHWEKFLTINEMLRPGTTPPRPSTATLEQFETWFGAISTAWDKADDYVKKAPGRKKPRSHIISVNFVMHQLLLRVSMGAYLFYRGEFPLTNIGKPASLKATVGYMVRLCESTLTSELVRVPTYRLVPSSKEEAHQAPATLPNGEAHLAPEEQATATAKAAATTLPA